MLAALLMGLIIWQFSSSLPIVVTLIISGLVYGLALLLTGSINLSDMRSVFGSFSRSSAD